MRELIAVGVPQHIAMATTGHKTVAVFTRYAIVSERDMAKAAAKIQARAINGK